MIMVSYHGRSLKFDGHIRELTDIRVFRAEHGLPDTFAVATFEPKNYIGLGSIDHAGRGLNKLRDAVLNSIPKTLSMSGLLPFFNRLADIFCQELEAVNEQIGLREEEIAFATNGFDGVNQKVLFELVRHPHNPAAFVELYQLWLDESARVTWQVHTYTHNGVAWQINILNNAYGRIGLRVDTGESIAYLRDEALSCPAAGFMATLLEDVYDRIILAL